MLNKVKFTKSELEIMEVLWKEYRPLSSSEIIDLSVNRTWQEKTIHLLINSLLEKGAIEVVDFLKVKKTYARVFKAKISFEEYSTMQIKSFLSNKGLTSLPKIMASLIDSESDYSTKEQIINDLHDMLNERKNKD